MKQKRLDQSNPESEFQPRNHLLKAGKDPSADSRIRDLKPFLEEDELLSVAGRLQHSDFTYRDKHPWILPKKTRVTQKCWLNINMRKLCTWVKRHFSANQRATLDPKS